MSWWRRLVARFGGGPPTTDQDDRIRPCACCRFLERNGKCGHPDAVFELPDYHSGGFESVRAGFETCRSDPTMCGRSARWFEAGPLEEPVE